MDENNRTFWIAVPIVLILLAIGVALYYRSADLSAGGESATTTSKMTTTTPETKTSTTTPKTPVVGAPSSKMNASDFKLFVQAGHCVKTKISAPLRGHRAIDFKEVTIATNQEAWKCSDGEYYTP